MKTVLISGASGLIGKELVKKLKEKGYAVRTLSRKEEEHSYYWKLEEGIIDHAAFEDLDAIIHLAGASISKRWTKSYKKEIYESRIKSSDLLFEFATKLNTKLKVFISASGSNYYGTKTSSQIFKESDSASDDFLAKVCYDWEISASQFEKMGARVCMVRTTAVLSNNGGMFKELKPLAKNHLLSPLGSGKQILPWIHLDDIVQLYIHLLENPNLEGPYNAASSEILTQKEFTQKMMNAMGKKMILPAVPAFFLKIILGEMSSILLEGSAISNEKIKSTGFEFEYDSLDSALNELIP